MQATITSSHGQSTAIVAWVIGVAWQNQGFASEAARALVDWLRHHGADNIIADIDLRHRASTVVAARAGLRPADELAGSELVWRLPNEA